MLWGSPSFSMERSMWGGLQNSCQQSWLSFPNDSHHKRRAPRFNQALLAEPTPTRGHHQAPANWRALSKIRDIFCFRLLYSDMVCFVPRAPQNCSQTASGNSLSQRLAVSLVLLPHSCLHVSEQVFSFKAACTMQRTCVSGPKNTKFKSMFWHFHYLGKSIYLLLLSVSLGIKWGPSLSCEELIVRAGRPEVVFS